VDYCVNPYTGCLHGCIYCYAVFMQKFIAHEGQWGTFVDAKLNCAEVLAKEITRRKPGKVMVGSVTDAYQEVEEKFGLTRGCLEILVGTEFEVSILTKSDLILRDLDLISGNTNVDAGFTITTLDESMALLFEPGAPAPSRRLDAMAELSRSGANTWAFLGPLIPGVSDSPDALSDMLRAVEDAGAGSVLIDSMNFRYPMRRNVSERLEEKAPDLRKLFLRAMKDPGYQRSLAATVRDAVAKTSLRVDVCFDRQDS